MDAIVPYTSRPTGATGSLSVSTAWRPISARGGLRNDRPSLRAKEPMPMLPTSRYRVWLRRAILTVTGLILVGAGPAPSGAVAQESTRRVRAFLVGITYENTGRTLLPTSGRDVKE